MGRFRLVRVCTKHVVNTQFDDSLQNVVIQVHIGSKHISIIRFYSPPNCSLRLDKHKLNNLLNSVPKPFILAGDFNAHHILPGGVIPLMLVAELL
jgi:endonuclease/exonuclease/phosphatase (EEP) superfamily protein YafD